MSARNWTVPPGSALDSKSGVRFQTSPKSDINNSRRQVTMTYPELLTVALDFATAISWALWWDCTRQAHPDRHGGHATGRSRRRSPRPSLIGTRSFWVICGHTAQSPHPAAVAMGFPLAFADPPSSASGAGTHSPASDFHRENLDSAQAPNRSYLESLEFSWSYHLQRRSLAALTLIKAIGHPSGMLGALCPKDSPS